MSMSARTRGSDLQASPRRAPPPLQAGVARGATEHSQELARDGTVGQRDCPQTFGNERERFRNGARITLACPADPAQSVDMEPS